MTEPTVNNNRTKIEINATNIANMEKKIDHIEEAVSNHLPTKIDKLRADMEERDREQVKNNNQAMIKIASITSTVIVLSQIVLYFINK